jgi:penicillin-insensitive murein endopeptidase
MLRRALSLASAVSACLTLAGCANTPSPLVPNVTGSVGVPHRGVLTAGVELPRESAGLAWLRNDDRHYGVPRLVSALVHAAKKVDDARPGGTLVVGDLSRKNGGELSGHASHRVGRDVDLLLYMTTLDGAPVRSRGFSSVGTDGLAYDKNRSEYLRLDVEREWLLVKALVEDTEANVQWIFVHQNIEALLLEWARARGEPTETVYRAMTMMLRPKPPADPHDDHLHVRTECLPDEVDHGCVPFGPVWPWLKRASRPSPSTADLLRELLGPIGGAPATMALADVREEPSF